MGKVDFSEGALANFVDYLQVLKLFDFECQLVAKKIKLNKNMNQGNNIFYDMFKTKTLVRCKYLHLHYIYNKNDSFDEVLENFL